jgi:hypothetical protein
LFFLTAQARTFLYDDSTGKVLHCSPQSAGTGRPQEDAYYKCYTNSLSNFNLNVTVLALQRLCSLYNIDDYYFPSNFRSAVGGAVSSIPATTGFNCLNIGGSDSEAKRYWRKNGISITETSISPNMKIYGCLNSGVGGATTAQPSKSQIASIKLLSSNLWSVTQGLSVYNLYKTTVGKNLGLI